MKKKIRVVLADDHEIVRAGLKSLLAAEPDMDVVADTGEGRGAVRLAGELRPDVVVMDITMADLNGIDATQQITGGKNPVKVLCLSMHKQKQMINAALRAGAGGYLAKNCAVRELAVAIRTVVSGSIYLSPEIKNEVVQDIVRGGGDAAGGVYSKLTQREREVLRLIARGRSTKEVGGDLNVSEKTVATHRSSIMRKLGLSSIADLTRCAIREGLVEP